MKLYLCGPITTDPYRYRGNFSVTGELLTKHGFDVVDPTRAEIPDGTWLDYMRRGVTDLATCDGLALMPRWERGTGTHVEVQLAHGLGLPIRSVAGWIAEGAA